MNRETLISQIGVSQQTALKSKPVLATGELVLGAALRRPRLRPRIPNLCPQSPHEARQHRPPFPRCFPTGSTAGAAQPHRWPSNRIVLTTSLDPFLDDRLRDGSKTCLTLLRSLAGHARMFQTLTCSLARQLDRCTNTIRAYRDELVEAGYIWWTTDRRTGISTIFIRTAVEPPSRRAALEGGAQFLAPIKPSKEILPPQRRPAVWQAPVKALVKGVLRPIRTFCPPVRTVAEQIAILMGRRESGLA